MMMRMLQLMGRQEVIVPQLETRMFKLNSQISYSRKGLRNALKSWLRRPKQTGPLTSSDFAGLPAVMYHHSSIESQIRQLADLAFMVQVSAFSWRVVLASSHRHTRERVYLLTRSALCLSMCVASSLTGCGTVCTVRTSRRRCRCTAW
jgi:hypothetical protein